MSFISEEKGKSTNLAWIREMEKKTIDPLLCVVNVRKILAVAQIPPKRFRIKDLFKAQFQGFYVLEAFVFAVFSLHGKPNNFFLASSRFICFVSAGTEI